MKMFFKNTLKLSIALLIATPSLAASFQGVCNELNEELMANVKKNLREDDKIEYFEPLKECSVNKNGEIDEMYLVSERIDIDGIEKALSHKSIRNLTYFLDNGFYQEEPAVFNDFPTAINKLPNLEELTLKYYRNVFNHGDYVDVERKINASVFNLVSKKIKTITLDHIKIDESVIEQLGKLKSLEKLIVYSGYISQHYTSNESNYKLLVKLNNIDTIILDEKVVNANHKYSGECQKMEDYLWPNALENIQSKDNKSLIIPLRECILNSKGEVSELYFVSQRNNKEVIEKALSLSQKSIEKLTYFIDSYDVSNKKATYEEFPIIINQMSNLKELTLKYKHEVIYNEELSYLNEKEVNPNILKISSKKLKTLTLDHVIITDEIIKRINEISSLEELYVFTGENYENDISVDNEVRERLETLNKNKKLKIMVDFRELYIINDELPISTNNRCGKDDGICPSGKCCSKYGYCGKTEEYCGKGCQSEFGECKTTTTTTTTTKKSLPTSTNDRCGKDYGVCPSGKCCSKYGYCGKSDDHCGKGCQSEFGKCKSNSTTTTTTTKKSLPTSNNDRCGNDYGVCPSGKCCSKYGYCGKSDDHCGKGCQSEFGKCKSVTTTTTTTTKKSLPTSTNDRCGKDYGVCPSGKCCSKYGYCGKSDDHCGKGCQSEFGKCKSSTTTTKKSLPTSTNDRCGKDYGVCPSGKCCSKYGYCGKSDDHCGKGCQSEFGKCKSSTTTTKKSLPTSTNDRCGKDYGVCPSGKCCSKYGYCGKSEAHCGKGCQSEFGKCN